MLYNSRIPVIHDSEIQGFIEKERRRQFFGLEMIASENYPSQAVLDAQGSILTNKYAEGYPHQRYYGGCEWMDAIELCAQERACKLLGAQAANVQPHSGSSANLAAMMSLLKPQDKILGMSLSHGGHLTHGAKFNFSGQFYQAAFYGVDPETGLLDYNALEKTVEQWQPRLLIAGASSYPRKIDFKKIHAIASHYGILWMADISHISGLIATGLHPSPLGMADVVTTTTHKTLRGPRGGMILTSSEHIKKVNTAVFPGTQGGPLMHVIAAKAVAFKEALDPSFKEYQQKVIDNAQALATALKDLGCQLITDGTDNHLVLVSCATVKNLSGKQVQQWAESAGITLNKNVIPNDPLGTMHTSGFRLGTPALTTRGFSPVQMRLIAQWIVRIMRSEGESSVLKAIEHEVQTCAQEFPLF